jgi:hypothetical protein
MIGIPVAKCGNASANHASRTYRLVVVQVGLGRQTPLIHARQMVVPDEEKLDYEILCNH